MNGNFTLCTLQTLPSFSIQVCLNDESVGGGLYCTHVKQTSNWKFYSMKSFLHVIENHIKFEFVPNNKLKNDQFVLDWILRRKSSVEHTLYQQARAVTQKSWSKLLSGATPKLEACIRQIDPTSSDVCFLCRWISLWRLQITRKMTDVCLYSTCAL